MILLNARISTRVVTHTLLSVLKHYCLPDIYLNMNVNLRRMYIHMASISVFMLHIKKISLSRVIKLTCKWQDVFL